MDAPDMQSRAGGGGVIGTLKLVAAVAALTLAVVGILVVGDVLSMSDFKSLALKTMGVAAIVALVSVVLAMLMGKRD